MKLLIIFVAIALISVHAYQFESQTTFEAEKKKGGARGGPKKGLGSLKVSKKELKALKGLKEKLEKELSEEDLEALKEKLEGLDKAELKEALQALKEEVEADGGAEAVKKAAKKVGGKKGGAKKFLSLENEGWDRRPMRSRSSRCNA